MEDGRGSDGRPRPRPQEQGHRLGGACNRPCSRALQLVHGSSRPSGWPSDEIFASQVCLSRSKPEATRLPARKVTDGGQFSSTDALVHQTQAGVAEGPPRYDPLGEPHARSSCRLRRHLGHHFSAGVDQRECWCGQYPIPADSVGLPWSRGSHSLQLPRGVADARRDGHQHQLVGLRRDAGGRRYHLRDLDVRGTDRWSLSSRLRCHLDRDRWVRLG
jgi:hypothetical protein